MFFIFISPERACLSTTRPQSSFAKGWRVARERPRLQDSDGVLIPRVEGAVCRSHEAEGRPTLQTMLGTRETTIRTTTYVQLLYVLPRHFPHRPRCPVAYFDPTLRADPLQCGHLQAGNAAEFSGKVFYEFIEERSNSVQMYHKSARHYAQLQAGSYRNFFGELPAETEEIQLENVCKFVLFVTTMRESPLNCD